MTTREKTTETETLLVYLPCYIDYGMALQQANKIREITENKASIPLKVMIMISCNGVELSNEERRAFEVNCDHAIIFPFGISGDINITQGFMHAIRLETDYLWILSSNDVVTDEFFKTIYDELVLKRHVNILVGCTSENLGIREVDSVFDEKNRDIPFGLISSVIYRTNKMDHNFDSAVQMNWTGWGQLAAIEASCIALNGLTVSLVPEILLYDRSLRTLEDPIAEEKRVRNGYAHSFFGMPIVINTLHADDLIQKQRYLDGWIRSNWYLVNYFLGTDFKLWNSHIASNQIWLREFSFAAVKNASLRFRLLFILAKYLNLHSLRTNSSARWVRQKLKG
jgi:hypothetical protein